jgi:hypothetical protein
LIVAAIDLFPAPLAFQKQERTLNGKKFFSFLLISLSENVHSIAFREFLCLIPVAITSTFMFPS